MMQIHSTEYRLRDPHPNHREASRFIFCVLLTALPVVAAGGNEDLFELSLQQLSNLEITTAAKVPERRDKTAATVSVISAGDIRRSGARNLADVLDRIPGLSIGSGQYGENFIAVRGLRTTWSEKVQLLLDGHLLNDVRSGSATFQFLDMLPLANIARIEVVRGPGSALYGANAFLGIINVITKRPKEISGVEATAGGEFESTGTVARRYNLLAGGQLAEDWLGSLNLNLLDAPGAELPVSADAFGRSGTADNHAKRLDVQGQLGHGPFTLRGRYLKRDAGRGFGPLYVLSDESKQQVEYAFLDAEYRSQPVTQSELTLRAYIHHQDSDNYYVGLPAGSIPPTSTYFPWNGTGFIGESLAKENIGGVEAQLDYQRITAHTITAGLAWRHEKLYDPQLFANFDPNPLPAVTEVSSYYNWINPASRNISSIYGQDLWDISADLRATLGARYDYYSDFGSTVNPRVGLTWQISPTLCTRLTYGSAFRAPSFLEQHVKNNPLAQGNPDLKPEQVDTWEASLRWKGNWTQLETTVFYSNIDQFIDIPTTTTQYQNLGHAHVRGAEIEGHYHFQHGPLLSTNYSYADPDFSGREPTTRVAEQRLNLIADIPLPASLNWNIHGQWRASTPRTHNDPRPSRAAVWIVNTAFSGHWGSWAVSMSVFNLTDVDFASAAPSGTLSNDFTAAGRSVTVDARYVF